MKLIKLTILLLALTLSTVACSKGDSADWISSDGSKIFVNGKQTYLTSFDGVNGKYAVDGDPIVLDYKLFEGAIRDSPDNRQGVHEADLSTYKKAKYFDAFIDTLSVVYFPLGKDSYKVVSISTQDKAMKPLEVARPDAYSTLSSLKFEPIKTATFAKSIVVKGNDKNLIVRNTDITIPGILSVFKGTREVTQQVDIGGITVMKYETDNFDFYQYGDNLIKASKGVDIVEYITLKSL